MIQTIHHKALEALYQEGAGGKLPQKLVKRITAMLPVLDSAESLDEMDLPGFRLHRLKGELKGYWAVSVSGNWRLIFRFKDKGVFDLDLVDYH
ncbi:MAG: type II toxin-antitoxin system RelE/ParE family toxin [Nitrospinae bacterium]|nr:type II toxin-antitoxin system RelE/ParE family toxin [Nitrospinota bacterium]